MEGPGGHALAFLRGRVWAPAAGWSASVELLIRNGVSVWPRLSHPGKAPASSIGSCGIILLLVYLPAFIFSHLSGQVPTHSHPTLSFIWKTL